MFEDLVELNPDALLADGFEDAYIGVGQQFNTYLAVYDYDLCVHVLVEQGLSVEEAIEYIEFNVVGAYVGPNSPLFLRRPSD